MERVIVLGGDGFCGWPTALRLAGNGYHVLVVDNLSRRKIDIELGTCSLTNIANIDDRMQVANQLVGKIDFEKIDVASEPERLKNCLRSFQPTTVIQFAEQRAAPYSMIGDLERRYTVDNNVSGTHNLCSAIVEVDANIHLIHLGTMGVYGYSKQFGAIPEGYLDVNIKSTSEDVQILYPANPGSVYHMTKCLDQLLFQFYVKNWGLKVTDLHQGIVWGIETDETRLHEKLVNRFDYDGIYGTVLNRFLVQSVQNVPLTVYGIGGQSRAFIHINDTAQCLLLAVQNPPQETNKVRIFNQVSEVKSVGELATLIAELTKCEIQYISNPRKELSENELEVSNEGLVSLGFDPITLNEGLLEDVRILSAATASNFDAGKVLNSPKW